MLIIQVLVVLFALYALSRTVRRFRQRVIGLGELGLWSCFWIAAGVLVLKPEITQWVAGLLGVGRGADAMFYIGLIGLSYAFFRIYLRTRNLEQQITGLVRKLAIEGAKKNHEGATRDPS
jgi:small membrane protein